MSAALAFAAGATMKVSVIAAVALAAAAVMGRRSAAVRHSVLAIAVVCAALTPLLQAIVPVWTVRHVVDAGGVLATIQDAPAAAAGVALSRGPTLLEAAGMAGIVWLAGVAIGALVLAAGFARLAWIAARATPIDEGPLREAADALSRAYGLSRRVRLLESPHASLLATWGFVRPQIVLPAVSHQWSDERVRIVLGHELAHVKRHDWIAQMAGEALAIVYWFNPLVWALRRRIGLEGEQAADDAVLALGVAGGAYAAELVDLARALVSARPTFSLVPASAMARQSGLERRVRAMLNAGLNRTPITRAALAAIVLALAAVTVPLAGFGGQSGPAALSGSLSDQLGKVLPNVAVSLTNSATGVKAEQRTDGSGRFSFASLPSGSYVLDAVEMGFAPLHSTVTLAPGENASQDVTLRVGNLQETLTITPPAPGTTPVAPTTVPRKPTPQRDPNGARCAGTTVGGSIEPPTKITDVKPAYPEGRTDGGFVSLVGVIGTDGNVKTLTVDGTADPDYAKAAIAAAGQWQFTPTYLDCVPIEVVMKIAMMFRAE